MKISSIKLCGKLYPLSFSGQNGSEARSNGLTVNGDISKRRLSGSVDTDIPLSVANSKGNGTDNHSQYSSSVKIEIEIQREKTYVDDCLCAICYKCSCCYTSYLNSPLRRTWHNTRFYAKNLIEHKYFEGIILFLIAFSSFTLVSLT